MKIRRELDADGSTKGLDRGAVMEREGLAPALEGDLGMCPRPAREVVPARGEIPLSRLQALRLPGTEHVLANRQD